jgi:thiol-disulfide isomerase/thioredoxin
MNLLRLLLPVLSITLAAAEPAWLTNLEDGKQAARASGKPLLVYFTGSAWCPPCKLLHAEVMTSPAFEAYAASRVLVKLDYPPLSEREASKVKANPALGKLMTIKSDYKVTGFPTTILLNPDGKEYGRREGYGKGEGAAAFLRSLDQGK